MLSKLIHFLLIAFLGFTSQVTAQDSAVDSIISDLYESISFAENENPDFEKFKTLFVDDARLISVKDTTSFTLTPAEYEQNMNQQRKSGNIIAFEEKELHRKTERYGKILHVFSTYQTHLETADGMDSARGINSIQLMKVNGDWKVTSLIWYEEDEAFPLPEKYLPEKNN